MTWYDYATHLVFPLACLLVWLWLSFPKYREKDDTYECTLSVICKKFVRLLRRRDSRRVPHERRQSEATTVRSVGGIERDEL